MKFDVIIGNPPYQLSDGSGGSTDAAMPIYPKFIEQAQKLEPKFLSMIIPSKWMVGGRGLDMFRKKMFEDRHIKKMFDFEDASVCFAGIHLDGGVCYFLWEQDYSGNIEYTYQTKSGQELVKNRILGNDYFKFVIRDNRVIDLLKHLDLKKNETNISQNFSSIVSSTKPFGVRKDLFNAPAKYPQSGLKMEPFADSIKIFGVKGLKGGAKRRTGYVHQTFIQTGPIKDWKIFFTTTYSTGAIHYPDVILGEPMDTCTETFLVIGPFSTQEERDNCLKYMETQFFKALLYFGKGTMQVTRIVFSLIPLLDWKQPWTDEQLHTMFDLTEDQIQLIERLFE